MKTKVEFTNADNKCFQILGKDIFVKSYPVFWKEVTTLLSDKKPHLIITLNVDQTIRLEYSEAFRKAFGAASLITLDGMPIVKLAKIMKFENASRLTGADMLTNSCTFATEQNLKICLLGGSVTSSFNAKTYLLAKFPNLDINCIAFPFLDLNDLFNSQINEVVRSLERVKPDLVFICLGSPKQEIFYSTYEKILPGAVYIGAGASIDFLGGTIKRAPRLIQNLSLEWAWRLAQEPRRLGHRYLITSWKIIPIFIRSIKGLNKNGT